MFYKNPYQLLFQWLLFAGVILFLTYIVNDYGLLTHIISTDVTRISIIILLIFLGVSLYCAWRCFIIGNQINSFKQLSAQSANVLSEQNPNTANNPYCQNHIQNYFQGCYQGKQQSLMAELLAEKLRGANQIGWFFSSMIIKLGLLGTVIGFVIMLSSISTIDTLVVDDVKALMQQMTKGMGIAMNTTMVGLVCSMLTGLQYLLLDRHCDHLLTDIIEHGNKELVK